MNTGNGEEQMESPKAFVSYSWDDEGHKEWVADLATKLRGDGVDVTLDQWNMVPGDQLTSFMEKEIRDNDYVLIICTPNYRMKSDQRKGGVGYEGDIMTAEVLTKGNHRKFIPVFARGSWDESAPSWLKGKVYVDLSTEEKLEVNYSDLTATLHGTRPAAPPLRMRSRNIRRQEMKRSESDEPLGIVGVVVDEVTQPRLDGTPGSALHAVPLRLNRVPSQLWSELFVNSWNRPPQFTTMHRPGIASVRGDKIILNGTTIDEVKRYHRSTLVLCVNVANEKERECRDRERNEEEKRRQQVEAHRKEIEDGVKDISLPIRLHPHPLGLEWAQPGYRGSAPWMFSTAPISHSRIRYPSSSDFSPMMRPAPPTWRKPAGETALPARTAARRESRSTLKPPWRPALPQVPPEHRADGGEQ